MKSMLGTGLAIIVAGCATMSPAAQAGGLPSGQWRGFLLRNGIRAPMAVELSEANADWRGRFSAGSNLVALSGVRVSGTNIHFELPGEGVFEGSIAGDSMAGSVSGSPTSGSFTLMREESNPIGDPITSSGP